MKNQKMYEADDKMISIIRDNYNILQSLGSFGINLGFGDKTVREVCDEQNVDTYTFLAVVNLTINGYKEYDNADRLSLPTQFVHLPLPNRQPGQLTSIQFLNCSSLLF
jgi:hypothetical protein